MKRLWIPALLALALAALRCRRGTLGTRVMRSRTACRSGDVTQSRAILWTRVDGLTTPKQIKVEGWTNSSLSGPKAFKGKFKTTAARDWTVKIDVTRPAAGTQYWYQFKKDDSDTDDSGRHVQDRSGRELVERRRVHLDRRLRPVQGGRRQPVQQLGDAGPRAQSENADFFIYLGDTIYSDSSNRPGGPATTLADYRDAYKLQRTYPNLTNLQKSTSTYPLIDDHEVQNDFDGQTVNPARYAAGRQAFLENIPDP